MFGSKLTFLGQNWLFWVKIDIFGSKLRFLGQNWHLRVKIDIFGSKLKFLGKILGHIFDLIQKDTFGTKLIFWLKIDVFVPKLTFWVKIGNFNFFFQDWMFSGFFYNFQTIFCLRKLALENLESLSLGLVFSVGNKQLMVFEHRA